MPAIEALEAMETGIVFWAERDHAAEIKALGVRCGQLCIPGSMELMAPAAADWKAALAQQGFTLQTVFATYNGESYADIPTVQRTVGFVPPVSRGEREKRTCAVSDFAASLEVKSVACHIGCVPEDRNDTEYIAVRDLVRRVCRHAAGHGQTFALETGQEPAAALLQFLKDVDQPNLGINFDPANMILYGTGDPIDALDVLGPHLLSVHCKDGNWPPTGVPGALGVERPLGQGSVGIEKYLQKLKQIGFTGPLNIEREAENQQERMQDISMAVDLLKRLKEVMK